MGRAGLALTVTHATDVPYMYGAPFVDGPQPAGALSEAMMDYILGFITSLNPNDGIGSERTSTYSGLMKSVPMLTDAVNDSQTRCRSVLATVHVGQSGAHAARWGEHDGHPG